MIMQNTLYSFENVKAEDVFFVTKDKVKCVFQPAELPIDKKYDYDGHRLVIGEVAEND